MANDGNGGLLAGGGNRSLEELRISKTILGRKLDSISNDLRRASDTLRVVTENLRIRENRAPPVRRAYVSPMVACGQRRARRHVQPAPPEFSESDEGGIPNRRRYDEDSSTYEEVEQWILGEPRFAAQPRYLHHLQPPSSFSSPYTHKPPNHQFESQIEITDSYSTLLNSVNRCLTKPLNSKNRQQHADFSNSENKLQTKAITNENGGGCNSQLQFSAAASRVCEVNTSKQNNILVCDFTDTISRCSAPNYSVISQMGQTHENLVGTNSNSKPSVPRIKVTEIEGEDEPLSEPLSSVKLVVSSDCGELIGVENVGLSDSEVTVWVKDFANEDDGNAQNKDLVEVQRLFERAPVRDVFTWTAMVSGYIHNGMVDEARRTFDAMPEKNTVSWNAMIVGYVQSKKMDIARELFEAMTCRNVGSWNTMITGYAQSGEITLARNLFDRTPLDTFTCDGVCFAELVNDKIVLSVLVGQIVSTLGFRFENVKIKGVRRRQWQIAWSSPAFHRTIVLVPLWVWDELRREFSVGVYHSHKPNMGLCSIVVQLVRFCVLQPNSRSSSFSKNGRLK